MTFRGRSDGLVVESDRKNKSGRRQCVVPIALMDKPPLPASSVQFLKRTWLVDKSINFKCPLYSSNHCTLRHAPSPWTHILPISLETLKLSGSFTNRRCHAPSPCTHI